MGCELRGEFRRLYSSRRAATTHVGMSPVCRALGLGVREISVAAGTGADVLAGGAGAAGPTPDAPPPPAEIGAAPPAGEDDTPTPSAANSATTANGAATADGGAAADVQPAPVPQAPAGKGSKGGSRS